MMTTSRRGFLNYGCRAFSAAAGYAALGRLGQMNAWAAGNGDYKALVCVFMLGGNDCHNTIVPIATGLQNYAQYAAARQNLAIAQAQLNVVQAGADVYGLHPSLTEVQALYNQGKAAFAANVGSLVTPITRQQYLNNSVPVPDCLFSHSDQTNQWQTGQPNDFTTTGWGGRIADALQGINAPSTFPMVTATSVGGAYPVGNTSRPAFAPAGDSLGLNSTTLSQRTAAFQQLLSFDDGVQLMQASNQITAKGAADASLLKAALASAPALVTQFPSTKLGSQMKEVAQIVSVRGALGMSRQIFFVTIEGFDTHSNELPLQSGLLQDVSQSLNALYQATVELGVDSSVTAFTNSEFGRTLQPSSGGGTDHAWGGHQMIVGGAVKPGLYGTFPTLALSGPDDANSRGTLIPTTSVEQYGATLAQWFGVAPANLPAIFPTLGNFAASSLGFL